MIGLIISCLISSFFPLSIVEADNPWWNNDWDYHKTCNIANKIDEYQLLLNVSYDGGGDVSCEGHCQPDFDDLRFVYNNATELPYWFEKIVSGSYVWVWVNNSGNYSSFEMFYGNSGVSTTSDGYAVFDAFDGAEDGVGNWTEEIYQGAPDGDMVQSSDYARTGSYSANQITTSGQCTVFRRPVDVADKTLEVAVYLPNINEANYHLFSFQSQTTPTQDTWGWYGGFRNSDPWIGYFDGSWNDVGDYSEDTWYIFVFENFNLVAHTCDIKVLDENRDIIYSDTDCGWRNDIDAINHFFTLSVSPTVPCDTYLDNWLIRKYSDTPPSWSSFGSEQSAPSNNPPTLSNENPADDLGNVAITQATVSVTIEDIENTFNWTIQGQYITNTGANDASNGSKSANTITPLPYSTDIVWYVNVTDGYGWTKATYNFTTAANNPPTLSNENPADDLGNVAITQATVSVTIEDIETFDWTIQGQYITNTGANDASNGSKSANTITPLPCSTDIVWYINVTDGIDWTNATYNFTTRSQYILDPPASFTATADGRFQIDLSWTDDSKADSTLVEWSTAADEDHLGSWSLINAVSHGIATDGTNIWVVDGGADKVYKYDMVGNYIDSWECTALNYYPRGMGTNGVNIWVVNTGTNKDVYKYDMLGNYIDSWTITNENPHGIAADDTNIWVVDGSTAAVYKYDMTGNYIGSWNLTVPNDTPRGIVTDGNNIWVVDYYGAVYKYDMAGEYLDVWTGNTAPFGIATDSANIWILKYSTNEVYKYNIAGGGWGPGDNNFLYNDSGESTSDTGLDPGTHHFYKAWSWNNTDNCWSAGSTDDATTNTTNIIPLFNNEMPKNAASNIELQPTCSVTITDNDGHQMTCNFYTSPDASDWTHRQTNLTVLNESVSYVYAGANSYSTIYYWKITANDTYDNVSAIYYFTTKAEFTPDEDEDEDEDPLKNIGDPDIEGLDFSNIIAEDGFLALGFGPYIALFSDFFWGLFFGVIGVAIYTWKSNNYSLIGYLIAVLIFTRVVLPVGLADLMAILLGLATAGLVYRVFIKKKPPENDK